MDINRISETPLLDYHRYIYVYNYSFNINTKDRKGMTVKNLGATEFTKGRFSDNTVVGKWTLKTEEK